MSTVFSTATYHSLERAKERAGLSEKKASKMITTALKKGKRADDFNSMEKSYLEREAHNNCIAIAFNGFCYIVNSDGFCVTLYKLPSWFGKKKKFDGKEKIRNHKKYEKNNFTYETSEYSYMYC